MKVTVFGATGVVGRALLPLLAAEHDVVAVSRTARQRGPAGAGWSRTRPPATASTRPLEGAEVVYYLVHSLGARDFEQQDRAAAENVARAATRAGVRQIVYLGGLGGRRAGRVAAPAQPARDGRARSPSDGVPVTTLRAAMVVGKGSAAFETILGLVKRLPVMVTPSWVSTPTQPIALDDIARYLAGVCGNEAGARRGIRRRRAGGDDLQADDRADRALLGRRPLIVEVPVLTPRLSSLWLELVTPVNASVARPLVEGLRNPTVAREERIRALIPFELTSFDEAARQALRPSG